jgi:peptidoglycan/xylan/chitin deacetylase (PgdA/CDA1 family)
MTDSVPILMYHEITSRPDSRYRKYTLTPEELGRQLDWLLARGYTSVSLDDVYAAWRGERALPRRPVAITFDDGGRDCLEHAVPALVSRGFTGTFYIVAGVVGGSMQWLQREIGFELPAADWAMLRVAESAGMRCEAHSVSHPRLAKVSAETCREELVRGRAMLEDGLGREVRHLAYPFGSFSPETRAIAHDAGYVTACTTEEAIASPNDDLLTLPRVPVLGTEGMREFRHRVRTSRPVGRVRAGVRRIAHRFGFPPRRDSSK